MTDTTQAGTFTMIDHSLAQEVGLVCAAVYGEVKRHCGLKDGICKASLDTLGDGLHINRATVMRNIKTLCDSGYLIDQTPGLRNVPHTYILGKSVAERNSSKEVRADKVEDKSVVIRNSSNETVAPDNKSVAYNNSSTKTVAQSNLKIKDSLKPESIIKNNDIDILFTHFLEVSHISAPHNSAQKQAWESDLVAIYEMAESDLEETKDLMGLALSILDDKHYTVNGPHSLLATCESQAAKRKRGRRAKQAKEESTLPPSPDSPPPEPPPVWAETWEKIAGDLAAQIPREILSKCQPRPNDNGTYTLAVPEAFRLQVENRPKLKEMIFRAVQHHKSDSYHLEVIPL